MPNLPRLVVQKIQLNPQKRISLRSAWRIEAIERRSPHVPSERQKLNACYLFDPLDAKWQWVALSLIPSRPFHERAATVLAGLDGTTIRVASHVND